MSGLTGAPATQPARSSNPDEPAGSVGEPDDGRLRPRVRSGPRSARSQSAIHSPISWGASSRRSTALKSPTYAVILGIPMISRYADGGAKLQMDFPALRSSPPSASLTYLLRWINRCPPAWRPSRGILGTGQGRPGSSDSDVCLPHLRVVQQDLPVAFEDHRTFLDQVTASGDP